MPSPTMQGLFLLIAIILFLVRAFFPRTPVSLTTFGLAAFAASFLPR